MNKEVKKVKIGKRIYYDALTGEVVLDTGERKGSVTSTTIEQDIQTYKALSERNRDTFDYIELEYGQYAQDFAESNGYRVNPETKELEFSYPDPSEEEPKDPVYQPPLSEVVADLENRTKATEDAVLLLMMEGLM